MMILVHVIKYVHTENEEIRKNKCITKKICFNFEPGSNGLQVCDESDQNNTRTHTHKDSKCWLVHNNDLHSNIRRVSR